MKKCLIAIFLFFFIVSCNEESLDKKEIYGYNSCNEKESKTLIDAKGQIEYYEFYDVNGDIKIGINYLNGKPKLTLSQHPSLNMVYANLSEDCDSWHITVDVIIPPGTYIDNFTAMADNRIVEYECFEEAENGAKLVYTFSFKNNKSENAKFCLYCTYYLEELDLPLYFVRDSYPLGSCD